MHFKSIINTNRKTINTLLSPDASEKLDKVLYDNICLLIPYKIASYERAASEFSTNLAVQKGCLTWLNYVKSEIEDINIQMQTRIDFLNKSYIQDLLVDTVDIYFSERIGKLRALHDSLDEIFYTKLVQF